MACNHLRKLPLNLSGYRMVAASIPMVLRRLWYYRIRLLFLLFLWLLFLWHFGPPRAGSVQVSSCANVTTAELLGARRTRHGIPLILHQIFKGRHMPKPYEALVRACGEMNRDFLHVVWTDEDIDNFLRRERPELLPLFNRYTRGIEKADVFRLILIHHFGGVYIDLDVECLQPLATALDRFNSSCIFDREREEQSNILWVRQTVYMNSAIMCRPRHAVFKYLIGMLPQYWEEKETVARTGPIFISLVMPFFAAAAPAEDQVFQAPASAFSPHVDPNMVQHLDLFCFVGRLINYAGAPIRAEGCRRWQKSQRNDPSLLKDAILHHRFMHFGYLSNHGGGVMVDICDVNSVRRYRPNSG